MKTYNFTKSKGGPVLPVPPGKERITIQLETNILEYSRDAVECAGGRELSELDQQRVARLYRGRGSPRSRKFRDL